MKFFTQIFTNNDCYLAGRTFIPKGVMVHSTGANNPNLRRYVPGNEEIGYNTGGNHWDQDRDGVCVHGFIGKLADGSVGVVQTLPWNCRCGHCGSGPKGSANNTHIAFEICEDGLQDVIYFAAVYQAAVELTAYLCEQYGLDPLADGVVICHSEGHKRGIASNHADVMHWFPKFGKNMDTFRADVARRMEDDTLTQDQFDAMMDNYLARRAQNPPSEWATNPTGAYPNGIMAAAIAKGITDGTRPQSFATREEVAAMVNSVSKG